MTACPASSTVMSTQSVNENDSAYPAGFKTYLRADIPPTIDALGNLDLVHFKKVAVFCSVGCPAELIAQAEELMHTYRAPETTWVSGFHSPAERSCLTTLLRENQPVIICPARSLTTMRVRKEYKEALNQGRLLFLSFFRSHRHRADIAMALRRNRFVAAMAENVLFIHAAHGGKTEKFYREIAAWGKPLFTVPSELNQNLVALGAKPLNVNVLEF